MNDTEDLEKTVNKNTFDLGVMTASSISINTSSEIITITRDKLKLKLIDHSSELKDRDAWLTPLGILVTIIIAILTTDFKRFILDESVWSAIFYICAALSLFYTLKAVYMRPKKQSIDSFIDHLKTKDI